VLEVRCIFSRPVGIAEEVGGKNIRTASTAIIGTKKSPDRQRFGLSGFKKR
jgi:hypothetical protein